MIILTEHVDVNMFVLCYDGRVGVLATFNCMIFLYICVGILMEDLHMPSLPCPIISVQD